MNNQPTIKIVRLQTGEDIISKITEDGESDMVLLNNPMRMIVKRVETGQSIFMMMPWLPIEVIKEDSAIIYNSDIITMFDPKDSLVEYYQSLVNESILAILKNEDISFEDDMEEDEYDEEYELTEEELKEIEEHRKNKRLH
jgi:hypothetical protein